MISLDWGWGRIFAIACLCIAVECVCFIINCLCFTFGGCSAWVGDGVGSLSLAVLAVLLFVFAIASEGKVVGDGVGALSLSI